MQNEFGSHGADLLAVAECCDRDRAIYVADLKNRKLNGKIAGSEGALKIKMVNTGSKVYAAAGSKLLVIDPASDAVTKTIDLPGPLTLPDNTRLAGSAWTLASS